jgi:N-acetylglucosamine malate deacetylase 2
MKKSVVLAIFAHPDDEAFGAGGTLAKFTQTDDVYLICVTDGDNLEGGKKLGEIRQRELLNSAKILGIKKVFFLHYQDGSLNNNLYHEIAAKLQTYINKLKPQILLTFEIRGISGHLDHIAVSLITTYVFYKNKNIKELWYLIQIKQTTDKIKDYFIYFPPGLSKKDIDKTIDINKFIDIKIKAIKAHQSQAKDIENILKNLKDSPKEENFLVLKNK